MKELELKYGCNPNPVSYTHLRTKAADLCLKSIVTPRFLIFSGIISYSHYTGYKDEVNMLFRHKSAAFVRIGR